MAARKPFKVQSREQGRGRISTNSFATLKEAQDFVASHWQGADYIDGEASFHTDYCDFNCVGFVLADIGERYWVDREGFYEWEWKDLDGSKRFTVVAWSDEEDRSPQKTVIASFGTREQAIAEAIRLCNDATTIHVEDNGKNIGWAHDKDFYDDVPFEQVAYPADDSPVPF